MKFVIFLEVNSNTFAPELIIPVKGGKEFYVYHPWLSRFHDDTIKTGLIGPYRINSYLEDESISRYIYPEVK